MPENPVRSDSESRTGGGWGAPLGADFGPAEIRRHGLLFDGMLARGSGPSSLAGPPFGGAAFLRDGVSARSTAGPAVLPLPAVSAPSVGARAERFKPTGGRVRRQAVSPPQTRSITHLDLKSVARVSVMFYAIVLVVMVVASIFLWVVADATGAVHSIDHSVQSLFGVKHYELHPTTIAMYACAAGAVVAVTGTLFNLLAATVFNLIAEVVGGIRLKVADH